MKKIIAIFALVLIAAGFYDNLYELVFPPEEVVERVAEVPPPAEEPEAVEEEHEFIPPVETHPVKKLAPVAVQKPADVKLIIREIKFDGVTAFSTDVLKAEVQEFIGKEVTVQEAFAIPAKITNYYQAQNLVARATLVGSLTRDGLLKIGVIESQMTQTQVDKSLAAVAAATPVIKSEAPISNVAKLEVGELAPKSLPDMPVKAEPVAPPSPQAAVSDAQNETDFILKHYANRSRQYELIVDNYGYSATGTNRLGAAIDIDRALAQDDKLSLFGLKSQGSSYLRAAYQWATGLDGLSIGVNVAKLNYEIVNSLQTAVYVSGDTVKKGFQVVYDLVADAGESSSLGLIYDSKSITNTALSYADSAIYTSKSTGFEFKGQIRELVPGGAVMSYDAMLTRGQVDMMGSPNYAADASGENTQGAFSKLRFNGSILQPLGGINALYGGLTVQVASKNLDASEKMYLGGPLGVRAYGVGEGAGSDGRLATLELRHKLGLKTTFAEFYDWGQIRPYHDGSFTPSSANNATLKGFGVSMSHQFDSGISMKATWARRQGEAPDPSSMPHGHDGQFDRNRFWLTMESRF